MMQKSKTFTTILSVKKCHFHYDMQKIVVYLTSFTRVLKWPTRAKKGPIYTRTS
jgi:hypothetical protein